MRLIDYENDNGCIDKYAGLIKHVYRSYPLFAERRARQARNMLSNDNPFLHYGSRRNFLITENGKAAAHISAIIDSRMPSRIGLLGCFDSIKDPKYAKQAIDAAVGYLSDKGKKTIRGPIDFTTWQSFRVSYPEADKPFSLEPFTRGYYRNFFEKHGFKTAQRNISTVASVSRSGFGEYKKLYNGLKNNNFTFEFANGRKLLKYLPEVHDLAVKTFAGSWSFVKISYEEFVYDFRNSTEPSSFLLLVRNKDKKAVAFLSGASDTDPVFGTRIVLKTVGVLARYQNMGIARALFYSAYLKARQDKAAGFIFSTMRAGNKKIMGLTGCYHDVYRKYSVYEMDT